MIDLKNMITKQQKFIDDNDIVGKHDGNIDFFSDDDNEKDMLGEAAETVNDDGLQTDNQEEDSSHHAQYPMIPEADAVIRSAGPMNGRRPGPDSKAAKVTAFSNNEEANQKKHQGGGNMGGLVVSGIPMSQRVGAPIPNLSGVNAQYRKLNQPVPEEPADRISRTKTVKENKAIKEKLDAEYKQSIEGLSIVGTSANNKK